MAHSSLLATDGQGLQRVSAGAPPVLRWCSSVVGVESDAHHNLCQIVPFCVSSIILSGGCGAIEGEAFGFGDDELWGIARELGVHRETVGRYARGEESRCQSRPAVQVDQLEPDCRWT